MEHAGDVVGRYRLLRQLGTGGMGTVWLASRSDGFFDREVALKLLHEEHGGGEPEGRFLREREILGSLNHPGIAAILDAGQLESGRPFFAMEAVRGEPIDRYCAATSPSLTERLRLLHDAAAAVGYAHERHVIHRDLKPANLLVTDDGQVKLIDFGIARWSERALGRDAFVTQGPLRFLTPDFAAPEQLAGGKTTAATDVYALAKVADAILSDGERQGDLAAVLNAALRPIPEERYPDASALAADLRNVMAGEPVRIREISRWSKVRRWLWLQRDLAAGIGAAAAILVAALMVASTRYGRAKSALVTAQQKHQATQRRGQKIEADLRKLGSTGIAGLGEDATPEVARQLMTEEMIHLARRYKTPAFMLSTARSAIELAEFQSKKAGEQSNVRRLAKDAKDLLRRLGERHPDAAEESGPDLDQLSRRADALLTEGS